MSGRVLARLAPVVLVVAASLSACGADGDTDSSATDQTTSSPTESSSESSSESPSGSPSESPSSADDSVAVTVTREGDSFTPNGERVELEVDQTLVLTIDADEAGDLHVHSTPEQDIAYDAGTTEHEIVIDRPGVVEVESHDPDLVLLQLEVR